MGTQKEDDRGPLSIQSSLVLIQHLNLLFALNFSFEWKKLGNSYLATGRRTWLFLEENSAALLETKAGAK